MYNFVDTTEVQESVFLPSEALQLNGEYIENLIEGYRTLNVTGREALSPELSVFETGARDGSSVKNKRYPARTIIVRYQLAAKTNEAFRKAYNKLGRILDVEDAEMIFNDEQDKFYRGTPTLIGEVEPGRNTVVGEIEFYCADPFKYSVYEYEATTGLDETSVVFNYEGTYKAYPKLVAEFYDEQDVGADGEAAQTLTGAGDCGYVSFFTENEKIVQLGDPAEADGDNSAYPASQTMMNQLFTGNAAWGTTAKNLWALNNGAIIRDNIVEAGNVASTVSAYNYSGVAGTTAKIIAEPIVTTGNKHIHYTVVANTNGRTASDVDVTVEIRARMTQGYLAKGCTLRASVYLGGVWKRVWLKGEYTPAWQKGKHFSTSITFKNVSVSTASATSLTGARFMVERMDNYGTSGGEIPSMACSSIPVSAYTTTAEPVEYYLAASDYGTANGMWHGASITRQIGADASGEVGASSFALTYKNQMRIGTGNGATKQMGAFQVHCADANGTIVAGVRIHKNQTGNNASMNFYVNGVKVHGEVIDLSYNGSPFKTNLSTVASSSIVKNGRYITFCIDGVKRVFESTEVANTKVTKVTFMFEQYSTVEPLTYNGLYWAKFVKTNCETYKDIPNKFSANDIVEADCNTGEITLNGAPAPELGAMGNNWEEFCLVPGLNQIGFSYSDWVTTDYAPTIKVKYREVYL